MQKQINIKKVTFLLQIYGLYYLNDFYTYLIIYLSKNNATWYTLEKSGSIDIYFALHLALLSQKLQIMTYQLIPMSSCFSAIL